MQRIFEVQERSEGETLLDAKLSFNRPMQQPENLIETYENGIVRRLVAAAERLGLQNYDEAILRILGLESTSESRNYLKRIKSE